jgi:hypothetical protein
MDAYLAFAKSGVETLLARQSARWDGAPDGTLAITVTKQTSRTYWSMGGDKGSYRAGLVEEQPLELEPRRLDMRSWPVLDRLTEATGDPYYKRLADEMARAFGRDGFDPASGLGYLATSCEFDVVNRQPVPVMSQKDPIFKPAVDVPLDRLWAAAPEKMARMFKSTYYGLITRPDSMDYNRYCAYGWDDSAKRPSMAFNSRHVAFAQTGAMVIHWWGFHFARTGDRESLAWAQAMADKWQAAQHPETGLISHWFGSQQEGEPTQPPRPFTNQGDSLTAISLLRAAGELRRRPEGQALAEQVEAMGRRLLQGLARYGYVRDERLFPQWIDLDGRVRRETTFYHFASQAEKDEAVRLDPSLKDVAVFLGSGFFVDGPSAIGVNNPTPHDVALGAAMTGDAELLARAQTLAADMIEAAEGLAGEINDLGQWIYPASASYIKMLVLLHEMTGEDRYLAWARRLADREVTLLSGPPPAGEPEWWRQHFRNSILEAVLDLHLAAKDSGAHA